MKKIVSFVVLLICLMLSYQVVAKEMKELDVMSDSLSKISKKIQQGKFDGDDLTNWTKLTIKMKSAGSLCISNSETALLTLKAKMDGLGEEVKGEDKAVTQQRSDFQNEKDNLDKKLAKCNLYVVSGEEFFTERLR